MEFNPAVAFETIVKQGVAKILMDEKILKLYLTHGENIPKTDENKIIQERLNASKVRLNDAFYQLNERYSLNSVRNISKLAEETASNILKTDLTEFPQIRYFEITFSVEQHEILRDGTTKIEKMQLVSKKRTRDHFKGVPLDTLLENEGNLAKHFTKGHTGVQDATSPNVSPVSDSISDTSRGDKKRARPSSRDSGSSSGTNRSGGGSIRKTAKKRGYIYSRLCYA